MLTRREPRRFRVPAGLSRSAAGLLAALLFVSPGCEAKAAGPPSPIVVQVWLQGSPSAVADAIVNACYLFELNGVDRRLVSRFTEVSGSPEAVSLLDDQCRGAMELSKTPWFEPNAINVYVSSRGSNLSCRDERRAIYLSPESSLDSFAHELGHALGLHDPLECSHADDCPESFRPDNIMWRGGGTLKARFTARQLEVIGLCLGRFPERCVRGEIDAKSIAAAGGGGERSGYDGYGSSAEVMQALRERHAALSRHSQRHSACGRLSELGELVKRYSRHYYAKE